MQRFARCSTGNHEARWTFEHTPDFLLHETQLATLLAREGCCAVRVPTPERFAVHKPIVSQLRTGRGAKAERDVRQAAVLLAALAEHHPGAIESAMHALPEAARRHVLAAMTTLAPMVERCHPRVFEALAA